MLFIVLKFIIVLKSPYSFKLGFNTISLNNLLKIFPLFVLGKSSKKYIFFGIANDPKFPKIFLFKFFFNLEKSGNFLLDTINNIRLNPSI